MKSAAISVAICASCALVTTSSHHPPWLERMTQAERASFLAILRYMDCLRPLAEQAKAGPPLTDAQLERLGYRCRPELRDAATKREHYWSAERGIAPDDALFYAPTRAERIILQERELAGMAWCDVRRCFAE
jgi:hypothetical protein